MRVLAGTSGFSYKEWKGSFYPEDLPAEEMLALLLREASGRRDQQHVLPHAEARAAGGLGRAGPARVPFRPEGVPADHAPQAPQGSRRRGRVLLPDGLDPRRAARPGALPASAESEEGPAAPGGLPRRAARGRAGGVRVPARLLVRGRRLRGAALARRGPLHRRGRGARDAARRDGALGLPAPAPPGLRRRGRRRLGARKSAAQSWSDAYVFFKHEDAGSGPKLAARLLEVLGVARNGGRGNEDVAVRT